MELDEETLLEGLAREVIRRAQVLRKELNLPVDHVADTLEVYATGKILEAVRRHEDLIKSEVRVKNIRIVDKPTEGAKRWSIEGMGEIALKLQP
jgi:isoleucyl-tRNA synthetase